MGMSCCSCRQRQDPAGATTKGQLPVGSSVRMPRSWQHKTGVKAVLYLFVLYLLRLTVLWITTSSMHSGPPSQDHYIPLLHPHSLPFSKIGKLQIVLASCSANRKFPHGLGCFLCDNTRQCTAQTGMGCSSRFLYSSCSW